MEDSKVKLAQQLRDAHGVTEITATVEYSTQRRERTPNATAVGLADWGPAVMSNGNGNK